MRFVSTRNPQRRATFAEAVRVGPAPDGGVFVPEPIACFRDVPNLLAMEGRDRALTILHRLLGEEFSLEELEGPVFETFEHAPRLVKITDRVLALELFHGPSHSMKDFGAGFLARMLAFLDAKAGPRLRTVLVAASGDLGAAVARAFWHQRGCRVVILYPRNRIPALRELQLAGLGENILAYAVDGTLDECQELVRTCFRDPQLVKGLNLVSAGPENVANLLALVPVYFEALAQLRALGLRDAPVVAVPSGSLGTLLAGLLTRAMGLPIRAFVAATNANHAIAEGLASGTLEPRPPLDTLAPALDTGNPAAWEGLQYLLGRAAEGPKAILRAGSLDDQTIRRALWELHHFGYLAEPQGAVAFGALEERRGLGETGLFLAPAHPALASDLLKEDMNLDVDLPEALQEAAVRPLLARPLPADPEVLKRELLA